MDRDIYYSIEWQMVRGIARLIIHNSRTEPGEDVTQSIGDGLSLTCSCCDQLHRCGMRGQYSNGGDRMYNPSASGTCSGFDLAH